METKRAHILIIEDDEDIQQLVSFNLIKAGFHVTCADDGESGLLYLKSDTFDCLILDLMLPGISGLDICKKLRQSKDKKETPVIMLTAKGEEDDIIAGFDCGADDYITKPFSPKVLIARVKSILRRGTIEHKKNDDKQLLVINNLTIDNGHHEVKVGNNLINLTITEFNILALLARKPGWVYSRQQIIDEVRGNDYYITPRAIDVQVFGLRKKLGLAGEHIETVRGIGYRFKV